VIVLLAAWQNNERKQEIKRNENRVVEIHLQEEIWK